MTRRLERVKGVIAQEISKIILYRLQDPRINLVSVTRVAPSPDLRMAKVYVSIPCDESSQQKTLECPETCKGVYTVGNGLTFKVEKHAVFDFLSG